MIRTRLREEGNTLGLVKTIGQIWRKDGFKGYYRGLDAQVHPQFHYPYPIDSYKFVVFFSCSAPCQTPQSRCSPMSWSSTGFIGWPPSDPGNNEFFFVIFNELLGAIHPRFQSIRQKPSISIHCGLHFVHSCILLTQQASSPQTTTQLHLLIFFTFVDFFHIVLCCPFSNSIWKTAI